MNNYEFHSTLDITIDEVINFSSLLSKFSPESKKNKKRDGLTCWIRANLGF